MSVHAVAPQPQPIQPPPLYYLGMAVSCEDRGPGRVTFEEIDRRPELRMLRVIYAHGKPLEAVPVVLRAWHVTFHPELPVLVLPYLNAGLIGHHAAYGVGHDERVVKAVLAEQGRWAA